MKLKIGAHVYNAQTVDTLEPPLVRGRINYTQRTILIAKRAGQPRRVRSPKGLEHTFWHEVTHGILHSMGSRKMYDEAFVDELATRIGQVFNQVKDGINV